jgi:hypothetical protein
MPSRILLCVPLYCVFRYSDVLLSRLIADAFSLSLSTEQILADAVAGPRDQDDLSVDASEGPRPEGAVRETDVLADGLVRKSLNRMSFLKRSLSV